jgi:prepilin-type N-terminal cleavage/methylation domain-containing protein
MANKRKKSGSFAGQPAERLGLSLNKDVRRHALWCGGNQAGFSLVELLIAMAVGSILVTGMATLLFSSLHIFGTGNANVEVQNESQLVMSLTVDSIMEAEGLCMRIPALDGNTESILLGDFVVNTAPPGGGTVRFQALFRGRVLTYLPTDDTGDPLTEMDMMDFPDVGFPEIVNVDATHENAPYNGYCMLVAGEASREAAAAAGLARIQQFIDRMDAAARRPWLMGEFVNRFRVIPDVNRAMVNGVAELPGLIGDFGDLDVALPMERITFVNGDQQDNFFFNEPFTLRVELGFAVPLNDEWVERNIEDSVAIRSRLDNIYVEVDAGAEATGSIAREMQEYRLR